MQRRKNRNLKMERKIMKIWGIKKEKDLKVVERKNERLRLGGGGG